MIPCAGLLSCGATELARGVCAAAIAGANKASAMVETKTPGVILYTASISSLGASKLGAVTNDSTPVAPSIVNWPWSAPPTSE